MKYPIIMVVGKAGSGKDTIAHILADTLDGCRIALADPIKDIARTVFGFTDRQLWGPSEARSEEIPNPPYSRYDFDIKPPTSLPWHSDYVKWIAELQGNAMLAVNANRFKTWWDAHISGRKTVSARHVLQTLGTEFGRKIDQNIWVNIALKRADDILVDSLNKNQAVVISDGRFRNEVLAVKRAGGVVIHIVNPKEVTTEDKHQSEAEQDSIPEFWYDLTYVNHKKGVDALRNDVLHWDL